MEQSHRHQRGGGDEVLAEESNTSVLLPMGLFFKNGSVRRRGMFEPPHKGEPLMPRPFAVDGSKQPRRKKLLLRRIGDMLITRKINDKGVNRGQVSQN